MDVFTQINDSRWLHMEITEKISQAIEEDDCYTIFEVLIPAILNLDKNLLLKMYPIPIPKSSEIGTWVIAILAKDKISESFPWHPTERPDQLSLHDEMLKRLNINLFKH